MHTVVNYIDTATQMFPTRSEAHENALRVWHKNSDAKRMPHRDCTTVNGNTIAPQSADAVMTSYKEPNSCSQDSYRIFGTFYLFMFTDCVCQEINRERIPL
jgi:hypothetical protein